MRQQSENLCRPLANEDFGVQPMDDASPPKWHLAHSSWFFETFLLKPYLPGYQTFNPRYEHLFNSYYNGVGSAYPRSRRGSLSRPTVAEVFDYRRHVNDGVVALMSGIDGDLRSTVVQRLELGVHHEQQHQELLLTDLKYNLGNNPLLPAYREDLPACEPTNDVLAALTYSEFAGGVVSVGAGDGGFSFDNELPRHTVLLHPYALADRLVSNGEYRQFMDDGGYTNPTLWLSDGWVWLHSLRASDAVKIRGEADEIQAMSGDGPL